MSNLLLRGSRDIKEIMHTSSVTERKQGVEQNDDVTHRSAQVLSYFERILTKKPSIGSFVV